MDNPGASLIYPSSPPMIDIMVVLNDQGTCVSYRFIRNSWELPTYPYNGFLCWQIGSAENTLENSWPPNKGTKNGTL